MKTLSLCGLLLAACAYVSESYRVDGSAPPRAVFPHLAALVRAQGTAVNEQRTEVTFLIDDDRVYFLDVQGHLEIKIIFPEEKYPPADRPAKYAGLKTRAEALWQEADAKRATFEAAELEKARAAAEAAAAAPAPARPGPQVWFPPAGAAAAAPQQPAAATCCVNHQGYRCPDSSSADRCAGAFARCMAGCRLGDMGCSNGCLQSHPPDPSGCSADSSVSCP